MVDIFENEVFMRSWKSVISVRRCRMHSWRIVRCSLVRVDIGTGGLERWMLKTRWRRAILVNGGLNIQGFLDELEREVYNEAIGEMNEIGMI
jgi:hypothetical protein